MKPTIMWRSRVSLRGLGLLAFVASPYLYNSLMRGLSVDFTAGWLSSYLGLLDYLTVPLRLLGQGPLRAERHLFAGDEGLAAIFAQFAYFDIVLALLATALTTIVVSSTMIIPEGERVSPKLNRLHVVWSWPLAAILVVVAIATGWWMWFATIRSGSFFNGVNYHCAQYSGWLLSKHRRCLTTAESTFPETIDQLGWTLMVASAAMIALFSTTIGGVRAVWQKSRSRRVPQN